MNILLETYFQVWAKFDNSLLHKKACKYMKRLHAKTKRSPYMDFRRCFFRSFDYTIVVVEMKDAPLYIFAGWISRWIAQIAPKNAHILKNKRRWRRNNYFRAFLCMSNFFIISGILRPLVAKLSATYFHDRVKHLIGINGLIWSYMKKIETKICLIFLHYQIFFLIYKNSKYIDGSKILHTLRPYHYYFTMTCLKDSSSTQWSERGKD